MDQFLLQFCDKINPQYIVKQN